MTESDDGVVIGSGQGGTPLAIALANAGWQTDPLVASHLLLAVGKCPTRTRPTLLRRESTWTPVASSKSAIDSRPMPRPVGPVGRRESRGL